MTAQVIRGAVLPPSRRGDPYTVEVACPYCGARHTHGAGLDGLLLGSRQAHCGRGGYFIVAAASERRSSQRLPSAVRCGGRPGSGLSLGDAAKGARCSGAVASGRGAKAAYDSAGNAQGPRDEEKNPASFQAAKPSTGKSP